MPKGRAKAPVYRLGTGLRRKKAADLMVQIFFLEAELGRFLGGCWKDGLCRLMDLDQLKMNRSILDWLAGLLATHPLTDPMLMLGKGSTSTGM